MERLSVADYYREALDVLAEWGSEALTIASLCERLGVTKGSFYHHFGSMPAFVTQLLGYWEAEHGEVHVSPKTVPDPAQRLDALFDAAAQLPHETEAAIRAWGRSNTEVAESTERVDRRRERRLVDTVVALGVDRLRARVLGRLAVDALVGAQQREHPADVRKLRQVFDQVRRMILLEADPGLAARLAKIAD
ncbi:MAG TPA: helix-turn-helix domain-containing protein [Jatrophihabitans sp.]|nr:helix-turn-helix domain-containing protein [Jatrophihabitans sp.]